MTIKERIVELEKKANLLEAENKAAAAEAKENGVKYEPVNAPSVIYKIRRDIAALQLFAFAGLEDKIASASAGISMEMQLLLDRFINPHIGTSVEVQKGDTVTSLLIKYKDVKDVAAKIQAACEKQGLAVNYEKNIIE